MRIRAAGLGHRLDVLHGSDLLATIEVTDLSRLVKRAGTVVAAPPLELRNEHRRILVWLFGRALGEIQKDELHRALTLGDTTGRR